MKLSELPTHLLRELNARCSGLNATLGDRRVVLQAVSEACTEEIQQRIYGKDFPVLSEAEAAALAAQIKSSPYVDFWRLICELET
jgi:hypothetical protein